MSEIQIGGPVLCLAFDPHKRRLAAGGGGTAHVFTLSALCRLHQYFFLTDIVDHNDPLRHISPELDPEFITVSDVCFCNNGETLIIGFRESHLM
jgi:hypothetical protein